MAAAFVLHNIQEITAVIRSDILQDQLFNGFGAGNITIYFVCRIAFVL